MAFITLMCSGLNQCGIDEFMPAGLNRGLNRFKPGSGLNWPTLLHCTHDLRSALSHLFHFDLRVLGRSLVLGRQAALVDGHRDQLLQQVLHLLLVDVTHQQSRVLDRQVLLSARSQVKGQYVTHQQSRVLDRQVLLNARSQVKGQLGVRQGVTGILVGVLARRLSNYLLQS